MHSKKVLFRFFILLITGLTLFFVTSDVSRRFVQKNQAGADGSLGESVLLAIPFKPAESINYDVRLHRIKIGTASLLFDGFTQQNGRDALLFSFLTNVVRFKDSEKIYVDKDTFDPLWVKRDIAFLTAKEFIEEDYTQSLNSVTIKKSRNKKHVWTRKFDSREPFQHAIAGIYYCRALKDLDIGRQFKLNLPLYRLLLQVKRIEEIEVPAGKFKAFYLESIPNKYRFWLSADSLRLPLKVEGAVSFAPATLVMTGYKTN